ncbi:AIR carboxylase family protein [Candidatus Daviesbacteria bacterium]|nr:AIR carboxylase family protein [Candidatus Daviesbacteria bacterium]
MSTENREEPKQLAVLVLGSEDDLDYARKITDQLQEFGIEYQFRGGSAHTSPWHVFNIIRDVENGNSSIVYISVAGRSDALSAFIDSQTKFPVIAAPPKSEFGLAKYLSSIDTPAGIGVSLVIHPQAAAVSAAKIFALNNPSLARKIEELHEESVRKKITLDNKLIKKR